MLLQKDDFLSRYPVLCLICMTLFISTVRVSDTSWEVPETSLQTSLDKDS